MMQSPAAAARTPPRRRRRAPEVTLTPEDLENVKKKVKVSLKAQHRAITLKNYSGYLPPIHEWYVKNHPELCDQRNRLDREKFWRIISTSAGLKQQVDIFRIFLECRPHISLKKADGTPLRALVGTLSTYRSAFGWWMFTKKGKSIPYEWDSNLKGLFKGFKQQDANLKQKGVLPMKEGKTQLGVPLYENLGKYFWNEGMVSETFTNNWAWNLMCRSMNVCKLTLSALGWDGDCLTVEYGTTKNSKNCPDLLLKHV